MPTPSFSFALLVATFTGALCHLLIGGDGRQFLTCLVIGWLGFASGQIFGEIIGASVMTMGNLHVLHGLLGSIIAEGIMIFRRYRPR